MIFEDLSKFLRTPLTELDVECVFKYMFRTVNRNEFVEHFKRKGADALGLQNFVNHNPYVLCELKPGVYHYFLYGSIRDAMSYGARRDDLKAIIPYIDSLDLDELDKFAVPDEKSKLDAFVWEQSRNLIVYARRFLGKKGRFILTSNSMELDDLVFECLSSAIVAFYQTYPRYQTKLHAVNLLKSRIKSKGINMIKFYTAQRRARLINRGSGEFESVCMNIDALHDGAPQVGEFMAIQPTENEVEPALFVRDIRSVCETPREEELVVLMMGSYCPRFSKFMRQEYGLRQDNDDLFHRGLKREGDLEKYKEMALDYLGLGPESIDKLRAYASS